MKNIHITNQLKTCSPMGVVLTGKSQLATLQEIRTGEIGGQVPLECASCRNCIRAQFKNIFLQNGQEASRKDLAKIVELMSQ